MDSPPPKASAIPAALSKSGTPSAEQKPENPFELKPGWSKFTMENEIPICVFPSEEERYKAKFIEQVQQMPLPANAPITIGSYAPMCMSTECYDLPLMECWITREGKTLNVHTRFIAHHKDGATCSENCKSVTAGCNTPKLEPGTYTIKHGQKSFQLHIPSTPRKMCFGDS
jgi:hypothetical protein